MTISPIFVRPTDDQWVPTDPGVRRRVLTHDSQLMMVEFAFDAGAEGKLHTHPHTQASYVARGSFEVTIDGRTETLTQGQSFIVPSNVLHGVRALEPGLLVDCFAPPRADFVS